VAIREFQLERYFARWEFSARYLLSASDCEPLTVGELLAIAGEPLETLSRLGLGYTESQGSLRLRERIAALYPGLTAADIVVTNAPQEAIFLAMTTLLERGDRVVVQTPCYQSLLELAVHQGCDVHRWPLVETEEGWRMDLERLEALLAPGAKMLVINAPHNPTGHLPTPSEMDAVVAMAARRGAWLFSDEMYRGLEHRPEDRLPPAATCSARALSLGGMSKAYGLAGLRIGWLAIRDAAIREALLRWKDYTTICSSAPGELLAAIALEHQEAIVGRNSALVRSNLEAARAVATSSGVWAWRAPKAGSVALVRLVEGSAAAFCEAAVQEHGVMIVPSTLFDFGDSHLRLGFGRRSFQEALAALAPLLARSPSLAAPETSRG
jgi:aspartate/methionine/tyrosine aminotransferase